jgi:hypothetical protein
MTTIKANVSEMFSMIEPCYVSGSQAELGSTAGQLTWSNAKTIASKHESWLLSDLRSACDGVREWAFNMGAWDEREIEAWSDEECLALFAQNVASELRLLGSDESTFEEIVTKYLTTDWNAEGEYLVGNYHMVNQDCHVEYYTGV